MESDLTVTQKFQAFLEEESEYLTLKGVEAHFNHERSRVGVVDALYPT